MVLTTAWSESEKFCMDLRIFHGNQIDHAMQPFAVRPNVAPLDRPSLARIVNTDIVEPAPCDFGRVKEPWYHGSSDLVGTADESLIGFVCHLPKRSLC